jgi:phosphoglycolate phosphatase
VKYKLVIFDFDGTLADSFPWFISVANTIADKYQFKRIEVHEIETLRGYGARQIVQHLGVPWWKLPLIGRHMRRLTAENIGQIAVFEGVDRLFEQLSQAGVKIALVTSNACANARRVLGPDNAARIAFYECDVSMFGKSARFRRILKQSGVMPHEALCIGDEIRDLEAAAKAGIPFGAVAWGFTQIEALQAHAPAEVFMRMDEIAERIL